MTSDQPVSVHMRGKSGSIMAAAPSVVTFRHPGITTITIDGKAAYPTLVPGGLQVAIPTGLHKIVLR